jgi:hypothetical protein
VARRVANLISDDGINGMQQAQRGWTRGMNPELMKAGNYRCALAARTYTDAYIQVDVIGTPIAGFPMGNLILEIGGLQIKQRQFLLPANSGQWA